MTIQPMSSSFRNPPLDEVAADVQFAPLRLRSVDVAAYHAKIREAYPQAMDVPPLPPIFDMGGASADLPTPWVGHIGLIPRSRFISDDNEYVVQLQSDRLIANWRARPPHGRDYPRYQAVRERLQTAWTALHELSTNLKYTGPQPNHCDLTYFNKIPLPDNADWGDVGLFAKGFGFNEARSSSDRFSECRFVLRRQIDPTIVHGPAHLQVECSPFQTGVDRKGWALNISVRGRPSAPSLDGILAFFDIAHVEIVRCFSELTTETMHQQ